MPSLLEKKWSNKNLNLIIDFDEHQIVESRVIVSSMINLLDNAIKFAPRDGKLELKLFIIKVIIKS
ncbi:MAG: hypothetical protein ACLRNO_01655 [Thomasclavelia ramosa]